MRQALLLSLVTVLASPARGQDADASATTEATTEVPAAAPEAQPAPTTAAPIASSRGGYEARNHWENALEAKLTDLYDKEASDIESPSLILAAQWNYKFSHDTYLGFAGGGMPQPIDNVDEDTDIETSYALYYGGAYLAQGLYESRPFRAVVSVTAGRGLVYSRAKPPGQDLEADEHYFTMIEPGLFVTFFEYKGVELGLIASSRQVKLDVEKEKVAEDSDLSAIAYGLTFRTQRY